MTAKAADAMRLLEQVRDEDTRAALTINITDMCVAQPLAPAAEPVAGELLIKLSDSSGVPLRAQIAKKLADCAWAPHVTIRHLAFDVADVASVVIRKSVRLTDEDLVELARTGSVEHRFHIANRPNITVVVSDTLAEPAEPPVLRALANNDTAEISNQTVDVCLTAAREHPKLREALARRHDLSTEHATRLAVMLPEHWREELTRCFGLDKFAVEKLAIDTALKAVPESEDKGAARRVNLARDEGRLTGKYALSALKEGDELFFDHAAASLCECTVGQWRAALAMGGVRAAAMACHGMGLDRTAYPVVHRALQRSGRLHQALEGDAMAAAANIFRMYTVEKAQKSLRQLGGNA